MPRTRLEGAIVVDFREPARAPPEFEVVGSYALHSGPMEASEWIEFDVEHQGGQHRLDIYLTTEDSRPLRVRVGEEIVAESVGGKCTGTFEPKGLHWFRKEARIALGDEPGTARIGFQAHQYLPHIARFRLVPVGFMEEEDDDLDEDVVVPEDDEIDYDRSRMLTTFSFELGTCDGDDVEVLDLCLGGKMVSFRCGWAHSAIYVDSVRFGNAITSRDNITEAFPIGEKDRISKVTIGISRYGGADAGANLCCAFRDLAFGQGHSVEVGCEFHPSVKQWQFSRKRLGLNLWITSVAKSECDDIYRYGFTLSADPELKFNEKEFASFWDWLVEVKHVTRHFDYAGRDADLAPRDGGGSSIEVTRSRMQPLFDHLVESFGGRKPIPRSSGLVFGTYGYVHVAYDVFSIWIVRTRDNQIQTQLFVEGVQYDIQNATFDSTTDYETLRECRNAILALALATSLKDSELIFNLGLVRFAVFDENRPTPRELDDLRHEVPLYTTGYAPAASAKRIVDFLVLAGLRQVSYEAIFDPNDDTLGWDIYNVAAGFSAMGGNKTRLHATAAVCLVVQVGAPIILVIASFAGVEPKNNFTLTILRVVFGLYALLFEYRAFNGRADDNRLSMWLCALPDFRNDFVTLPHLRVNIIELGVIANTVCRVFVSCGIIALLLSSDTSIDVVLNALALYFVLQVDDDLVDSSHLADLKERQRLELFHLKSHALRTFALEKHPEHQRFENTVYSVPMDRLDTIASFRTYLGLLNLAILAVGTVYFAVAGFLFD